MSAGGLLKRSLEFTDQEESDCAHVISKDEFGQNIKRKKKSSHPINYSHISSNTDKQSSNIETSIKSSYSINHTDIRDSYSSDTNYDQFHDLLEGISPKEFSFSIKDSQQDSSSSFTDNKLNYPPGTFYGLPLTVKDCFKETRGIEKLYDWQEKCLTLPSLLSGGNLIYSLPTSGGKTLVAEILILQQLLSKCKNVILILPFVAIVQEKVRELMPFAEKLCFSVEEYAASKGKLPPVTRRKKRVLYIATIEKANALVNSLIEVKRLDSIGLVIVDELHMLSVQSRGATLESCISKLLFASDGAIQLVGMSATISNVSELAQFMRADIYTDSFRPVELKEYVKLNNSIYSIAANGGDIKLTLSRNITDSTYNKADPDQLLSLVQEVIPSSSCLIFCATKKNCENVAVMLANHLPQLHKNVKYIERKTLMKQLKMETTELCPILAKTLPYGIAYHHSGLTSDERNLIEDGYLQGTLCVITCTSTLAAGVNLPARRVILRSPYVGCEFISNSQYRQMCGRAGRSGLCQSGESILILKHEDKPKFLDILSFPCESCTSKLLYDNYRSLSSLLLSLIALKLVNNSKDLIPLLKCTLVYHQHDVSSLLNICQGILSSLMTSNYITMKSPDNKTKFQEFTITDIGRAVHKGCLDVSLASTVYNELYNAQKNLILTTDLHLLTLVVPIDLINSITPNWVVFFNKVSNLSPDEYRVTELYNIKMNVLTQKFHGLASKMSDKDTATYTRFYIALILHTVIKNSSNGIWKVADTFSCSRGLVQSILQQSSSYSSCLVHFTGELSNLWPLNTLLPIIVQKLFYAVSVELLPLMEIPGIKYGRARQLLKLGIKTPQDLVAYTSKELSEKVEYLYPGQAGKLIKSAKTLLAEKAELLQEEAQNLLDLVPL